jgi:hypothetical protein
MDERRCRHCQKLFQPSKYQPHQMVYGDPACQRKRRTEYHRQKIATDPEYREVCRDSPRKWRARHPHYWKRYRSDHPATVERNRQQQQARDRTRRLRHLANNTSALDLKHSAAQVSLFGAGTAHLASNNSVPAQVWVIETLAPRPGPVPPSCKQQPPGLEAATAG